ncbi:MAG: Nif3-like dinuclear metal center hexameric protein, partial [Verrucomicrobiales bacterium]|nr:Nif3-like dinuclear metal center hexameric protein [Verrucomicrobiales bacterium]
MPTDLKAIVKHTDRTLRISEIEDYDGAHNGLQMENNGKVKRIAAAVDASLSTVRLAAEAGADLLVVHHGLFWSPQHPWTGKKRELLAALV